MRNREITMGNRKMRNRKLCSVLGVAAAAAALMAMPMPNWASAVQSASAAEEGFVYYGRLANPGLVSFDISWVDPNNRLYFLANRSMLSVDIVPIGPNPVGLSIFGLNRLIPPSPHGFAGASSNTACSSGTAADCAGPNGVITFTNPKSATPELWVGDGPTASPVCIGSATCSTVKVFTVAGGTTPIGVINTKGKLRADELCFGDTNPGGIGQHFVAIANDADLPFPFVSIINTDDYSVVTKIVFDGAVAIPGTSGPKATAGIEQCQWDGLTNRFIINIPEVNGIEGAVVTIDPTSAVFPVTGSHDVPKGNCANPQGLAIGPDGFNQVLLGCNAVSPLPAGNGLQNSVIVDRATVNADNNGAAVVLNTFVNEGGADEVWFNPGDGHYYLALGSHNPELLGVIDSSNLFTDGVLDANVFIGGGGTAPTRRNHSVAADAVTNMVAFPVSPNGAGFTSTLCNTDAALGCIAVFGPNLFDDNEGGE